MKAIEDLFAVVPEHEHRKWAWRSLMKAEESYVRAQFEHGWDLGLLQFDEDVMDWARAYGHFQNRVWTFGWHVRNDFTRQRKAKGVTFREWFTTRLVLQVARTWSDFTLDGYFSLEHVNNIAGVYYEFHRQRPNLLRKITCENPEELADVVWLAARQYLLTYDPARPFGTWIKVLARNVLRRAGQIDAERKIRNSKTQKWTGFRAESNTMQRPAAATDLVLKNLVDLERPR